MIDLSMDPEDNQLSDDEDEELDLDFEDDDEAELNKKRMYNAPKHEVGSDSTGMVRQYDKSNNRTSLIINIVPT